MTIAIHQKVKQDRRCIVPVSWPPGKQLSADRRNEFAADKQLAEGRMSLVFKRRCQHHFAVAGDPQISRTVAQIVNGYPANLYVIAGGNHGFHPHADIMITTMKFCHVAVKCDIILIRDLTGGLTGRGPEMTVFLIVQIYPQSAGIAHRVWNKTGQRFVPPAQPATASRRDGG